MPNFYYTDENGQKYGLVTAQQLKELAVKGIIAPHTPLETEDGRKGLAGQIKGLFPMTVQHEEKPVHGTATTENIGSSNAKGTPWSRMSPEQRKTFIFRAFLCWFLLTVVGLICLGIKAWFDEIALEDKKKELKGEYEHLKYENERNRKMMEDGRRAILER